METLYGLYHRIPKKWRKPIFGWVLPFLFGLIITLIWDVGTLLVILFLLFAISFLVYELGLKGARVIGVWSITQYFKRIRGMLLFALLPTLWELIKKPSLESIIGICFLIIIAFSIWDKFDEIMGDFTRKTFGTRRRRR